jgi:hypothetical protein
MSSVTAERKAMLQQRLVPLIGKRVTLRIVGDKKDYEGLLGRYSERGRQFWTVKSGDGEVQCRAEASSIRSVEGLEATAVAPKTHERE